MPRLIINLDTSFVVALNWSANVIIYQPFEYSTYQYIQIVNLKKIAPDFWCILYIEKMVFSSIFIQICSINTSVDFMVRWWMYTNPQCFLSFLRHSHRIRPHLYHSSAVWTVFWRLSTAPVRGAPLLMHAAPPAGHEISPSPPLTGEL